MVTLFFLLLQAVIGSDVEGWFRDEAGSCDRWYKGKITGVRRHKKEQWYSILYEDDDIVRLVVACFSLLMTPSTCYSFCSNPT